MQPLYNSDQNQKKKSKTKKIETKNCSNKSMDNLKKSLRKNKTKIL